MPEREPQPFRGSILDADYPRTGVNIAGRFTVEHVFGNQHVAMGGKFVRTIGIVRATVKIGMQNLAYNMRRLVVLERIAVATG
jgi:hypothetical protein